MKYKHLTGCDQSVQWWYLSCHQLHNGEESSTSLSTSHPQEGVESNEVTSQPPFLQPDNPSVLNYSSQDVASSPFTNFIALLRMLSRALMHILHCGAQSCMWYLRWGLTNAKYSGRIISFEKLPMLCLMHPKMQFAPWLSGQTSGLCWAYCQAGLSDPFLQSCSPATHLPVCSCAQHYSIPAAEPGIYLCWISCHCWWPSAPMYQDPSARSLVPPESWQHLPV